jgi:hypothetical protein
MLNISNNRKFLNNITENNNNCTIKKKKKRFLILKIKEFLISIVTFF